MRGSIRKRGKTSWELKFDAGTVSGKRATRYKTVRGSYRDAQKELMRLLSASDEHRLPAPTRATVAEYVRAWLDGAHGLSPKTIERYRELAERQIFPHVGDTKVQRDGSRPNRSRIGTATCSRAACRPALWFTLIECSPRCWPVPRTVPGSGWRGRKPMASILSSATRACIASDARTARS